MGLTQLESTIHLALKSFTHFFLTPKICFFTTLQKSENHALNLFWDRYNQNIEEKIGNTKSLWTF